MASPPHLRDPSGQGTPTIGNAKKERAHSLSRSRSLRRSRDRPIAALCHTGDYQKDPGQDRDQFGLHHDSRTQTPAAAGCMVSATTPTQPSTISVATRCAETRRTHPSLARRHNANG